MRMSKSYYVVDVKPGKLHALGITKEQREIERERGKALRLALRSVPEATRRYQTKPEAETAMARVQERLAGKVISPAYHADRTQPKHIDVARWLEVVEQADLSLGF